MASIHSMGVHGPRRHVGPLRPALLSHTRSNDSLLIHSYHHREEKDEEEEEEVTSARRLTKDRADEVACDSHTAPSTRFHLTPPPPHTLCSLPARRHINAPRLPLLPRSAARLLTPRRSSSSSSSFVGEGSRAGRRGDGGRFFSPCNCVRRRTVLSIHLRG